MKLNNNREFFEYVESLLEDSKPIDEYRWFLTNEEPFSFDTVLVGLLVSRVSTLLDAETLDKLIYAYNERFYRGLDIEF